jgi:hypothetical protein
MLGRRLAGSLVGKRLGWRGLTFNAVINDIRCNLVAIDTRNVLAPDNLSRAGFTWIGVGRQPVPATFDKTWSGVIA